MQLYALDGAASYRLVVSLKLTEWAACSTTGSCSVCTVYMLILPLTASGRIHMYTVQAEWLPVTVYGLNLQTLLLFGTKRFHMVEPIAAVASWHYIDVSG